MKLTTALLERGATVVAHDPEAGPNFARHFGRRVVVEDREHDALTGSHALVLLTEWRSYRAPSFVEIKRRLLPSPLVLSSRNAKLSARK